MIVNTSFIILFLFAYLTDCSMLFDILKGKPEEVSALNGINKNTTYNNNIQQQQQQQQQHTATKSSVSKNVSRDDVVKFNKVLSYLLEKLNDEVSSNKNRSKKEDVSKTQRREMKYIVEKDEVGAAEQEMNEISLMSLLYEKPSEWYRCTRSCRTTRIRRCRLPLLCSVDVMMEDAYCYFPGSKCEKKVNNILGREKNVAKSETQSYGEDLPKDYDLNPPDATPDYGEEPVHSDIYDHIKDFVDYDFDDVMNVWDEIWDPGYPDIEDHLHQDFFNFELPNYSYDNSYDENLYPMYKPDSYLSPDNVYDDGNHDKYSYDVYDYGDSNHGDSNYGDSIYGDSNYGYHPPNNVEILDDSAESNVDSFADSGETEDEADSIGEPSKYNTSDCGISSVTTSKRFFRIIGGKEALIGAWPWQVAILNHYKEVKCGGTLIASRWVLTAAHCVRSKLYVKIGAHDINLWSTEKYLELKVSKAYRHPKYDPDFYNNDIALLKLPKDVFKLANTLKPACLPSSFERKQWKKSRRPMKCIVLGWGKERESHIFGSDVLRYAKVPLVSRKVCKKVYPEHKITRNMLCAGYLAGGPDACTGDSGGPLLCQVDSGRWLVKGVTSFGDGCGERGRLGVYTRVSNYISWINRTIGQAESHY